jgi:hypothetical protein
MVWRRLADLGPLAQTALVTGALVATWLLVAPLAASISGTAGLWAAAVAAGVCWMGAVFALSMSALVRSAAVMHQMLFGMLARAMFPLLLGAMLHMRVEWLATSGMIYYLIVCYMVSLAVETALLLAQIPTPMTPGSMTPKR